LLNSSKGRFRGRSRGSKALLLCVANCLVLYLLKSGAILVEKRSKGGGSLSNDFE
jgi:hypothetical protein